jgi:hypothetical protein
MSVAARSKWLVARYGIPLAVVLGLIGVLALGGAYSAYTTPPTEQVSTTVYDQRIESETTTSAVVTGDTDLYQDGATLENKPVYFVNATRNLTFQTVTSLPEGESVNVTQRLVLEHRATRDGKSFWSERRILETSEQQAATGQIVTETTVDMRAVQQTVAERRSEIGTVGTLQTVVQLRVSYETPNYSGTLNATAPIVLTERAYWMEGSLTDGQTHEETTSQEITQPPDLTRVGGLSLLGVVAMALAGVLGVSAIRGFDLNVIETELARSRYDEWISRGDLPTKSEKQYISIDTLEDIVDIAIDSNKRVIYDRRYEAYGVVDDDIVYYYAEGETEFEQWLGV